MLTRSDQILKIEKSHMSKSKYFKFDFPKFQNAILKLFIQEFQNRAYFLTYVIFQFSKFGPNA